MDTNNLVGELLEKGKTTVASSVKNTASDLGNSVTSQLGMKNRLSTQNSTSTSTPSDQIGGAVGEATGQETTDTSNEFTKEMVKDFYAPSAPVQPLGQSEDVLTQQKIAQVRQRILQERHNDVYFNAINNADAPKAREERPAEKMEREKMEDLQLNEQNKPNELPTAVLTGMTHVETAPGTVG